MTLNRGYSYHDQVSLQAEGVTLLDFYCRFYPHSTRSQWEERLKEGQISCNGEIKGPGYCLRRGDRLIYRRQPWQEPNPPAAIPILYEDDDLVVVDKPMGLPILPGAGFLRHTMLHWARQRYGPECTPVHRLGRFTSGALLLSRHPATARFCESEFKKQRMKKVYLALVSGSDIPDTLTIDAPIGPVPYGPLSTIHAHTPQGKAARSHVEVLERHAQKQTSLVRVQIFSGRPHQIRIHLAYAGWPLWGDPLYTHGGVPRSLGAGTRAPVPGDGGYLLHAWQLGFSHPLSRAWLEISAAPPPGLTPPVPPGN